MRVGAVRTASESIGNIVAGSTTQVATTVVGNWSSYIRVKVFGGVSARYQEEILICYWSGDTMNTFSSFNVISQGDLDILFDYSENTVTISVKNNGASTSYVVNVMIEATGTQQISWL